MPQPKSLDEVQALLQREGRQEFIPLLHPKLLEEAATSLVVWARVKGYPFWPAQVLNEQAAHKKLGKVSHRKSMDVPVMFFGTLEIAWIGSQDIVSFKDGVQQGYLTKGKHKNFLRACAQVHEFLVLDKKRKAPQYWWCRAPGNSSDGGEDEDVLATAPPSKPATPCGSKRKKGSSGGGARAAKEAVEEGSSSDEEQGDASEGDAEESDKEEQEEEEETAQRHAAKRQHPQPQRSSSSEPSQVDEQQPAVDADAADHQQQGQDADDDADAAQPEQAAAAPMDTDQPDADAEAAEEEQQPVVVSPKGRRGRQRGAAKAAAGGSRPSSSRPSASGSLVPAKRGAAQAASLTSSRSDMPSSRSLSEQPQQQQGDAATAMQPAGEACAAGKRVSLTTGSGGTTSHVPSSSTSTKQRAAIAAAEHAAAADEDSKLGSLGAHEDSKLGSSGPKDVAADVTTEMAAPPVRPPPRKRRKVGAEPAHTSSDGVPTGSGEEQPAAAAAAPAAAPAGPEAAGGHSGDPEGAAAGTAAAAAAAGAGAALDSALQPALQVKVSTVSSTSQDAPATAPPSATAAAAAAATAAVFDDDIYKLPAEIRRLAGIKLVKKPQGGSHPHAPHAEPHPQHQQAASSTRACKQLAPKQEESQAADSPRREREREEHVRGSEDGAGLDVMLPMLRRETRSGAGPRPGASKGQLGAASSRKAAGQQQQPQESDSFKPSSPTAADALTSKGSGPLEDRDRERDRQQRAAEREQQLQRKRERERERRQQRKERQRQQQEAEAAAAEHSGTSSDEEEGGRAAGPDDMAVEHAAGAVEQQQQQALPGGDAGMDAPEGEPPPGAAGSVKPERADSQGQQLEDMQVDAAQKADQQGNRLVDRSAATIDCSIMPSMPAEALIAELEGCLVGLLAGQQDGSTAGPAGDSGCPSSPVAGSEAGLVTASSLGPAGKPPRPSGSTGWVSKEGRGAKPGKGKRGGAAAAPAAAGAGSGAVPVVSVSAGSRKQTIPPVLATGGQPGSARAAAAAAQSAFGSKRTLLTKRSCDSQATTSDTPSADEQQQGPAPPTGSVDMEHDAAYEAHALQQPDGAAAQAAEGDEPAAAAAAAAEDAAAGGVTAEDLLDAEAAEALQFMQSQSLAMQPAPSMALPSLEPIPSPVLSELEAALQTVMSAHGLCMPSLQLPPSEPAVHKPPRLASVAECRGFQWPDCEPLVPPTHEFFYLPSTWLLARPPQYEVIKRSVWLSRPRPKRLHREEVNVCQCKPPAAGAASDFVGCGKNCLNRMSFVLCDTKYCPCGEACNNKPFQFNKTPRIEAFLTESRGYGVRACVPIKAHQFVIEYVGEVIDDKELARRMEAARSTAQHAYYIMELAPNTFLDARHRGNVARLLNSSCDPNCETQKWHDAATGEPRIGIFAKRDIAPGEELTYNYFFEQYSRNGIFNSAFFKCMCGAPNCRGTMDNPALNSRKNKDYGRRIEVFWDEDGMYYPGTIVGYSVQTRRHIILYDDGDQEKLVLDEVDHRWLDAGPAGAAAAAAGVTSAASAPALLQPAAASQRWSTAATTAGAAWGAVGGAGYEAGELGGEEEEGNQLQPRPSHEGLGGPPPKKRQRMLSGQANNSMLPPMRAGGLDNSYNSTSTTFNVSPSGGLLHSASAPAAFSARGGGARERSGSYNGADNAGSGGFATGGSMFGGDMESLLQAVEVELGGREAAAAAGGSDGAADDAVQPMQVDGGGSGRHHRVAESNPASPRHHHGAVTSSHAEPPPPMFTRPVVEVPPPMGLPSQGSLPPQHGGRSVGARSGHSLPSPHTGTSAARTPRNGHAVKSPSHRRQSQQQQQQQGVAGSWGGVHTAPPGSAHHPQPPSGHAAWTWGSGHAYGAPQPQHHHQPPGAHGDAQAHLPGLPGQQGGHAAGSSEAHGSGKPSVLPVIEEVLGIRISSFDMPLFQPTANGRHRSNSRQVTPPGFGSSLLAAASNGATPDIPPHLQRMPITTSSPGLGPSSHPSTANAHPSNGMLPPVSSSGPSPTAPGAVGAPSGHAPGVQPQGMAAEPLQGRLGSGQVVAGSGGPQASRLNEALALLVNSPILAAMTGLPGGLRSYEALAGELDLFKRNGSHSRKKLLTEQPVNGYPVAALPPVVTVASAAALTAKPPPATTALGPHALPSMHPQLH